MPKRKSKKDEHQAAVEAVLEAVRRAESARQKFDEGWRQLSKDKSDADQALREALDNLESISKGRSRNS
jgi:ABC-type nitrate/sulfonate/bicarbonate transport system substrate-binding protein